MSARAAIARAVIALGGNLGEREQTLRDAVRAIDSIGRVNVVAASGFVESHALKPDGVDEASPNYLNAVVLVEADLAPLDLLDALNRIEAEHGRLRETVWGDRTLDLDLIAFADVELQTPRLTLPHPRAWQRAFVLVPWLQVDPDAVLAGHGRVADLPAAAEETAWEHPAPPLLPLGGSTA